MAALKMGKRLEIKSLIVTFEQNAAVRYSVRYRFLADVIATGSGGRVVSTTVVRRRTVNTITVRLVSAGSPLCGVG